jgi:hypothetical protein
MTLSKRSLMIRVLLAVAALVLLACGLEREAAPAPEMQAAKTAADEGGAGVPGAPAPRATEEADKPRAGEDVLSPAEASKKKIIKTADVRMQVADYAACRAAIARHAAARDAYIASENENNSGYQLENTLVIRVAAERFDALLAALVGEASYLHTKTVNARDVTEEFVDMTARLRTKREVEARYVDILRQARTIPDVLAVERELRVLREEIESTEGRLKYLGDQVAYSTIRLTVYQKLAFEPAPGESLGSRLVTALREGWTGLVALFVGLVYLWPFWVFVALVVWLLVRYRRRLVARRAAALAAGAATPKS